MIIMHGSLFNDSQNHKYECRNHPVCRTVWKRAYNSLSLCAGRCTGQAGAYDNYFHAGQVYLAFTAATNILPDN